MHDQRTLDLYSLISLLLFPVVLVTLVFLSPVRAADTDVSEEVKEALSAMADYTVEQKNTAVENAREMMDAMDDRIHELEGKMEAGWDDMKASSRENYKASLKVMREKRNTLSEWYGSMRQSSGDAWQEVKTGFTESYNSLMQSVAEAKQELAKE